jgi:hypothetical protein
MVATSSFVPEVAAASNLVFHARWADTAFFSVNALDAASLTVLVIKFSSCGVMLVHFLATRDINGISPAFIRRFNVTPVWHGKQSRSGLIGFEVKRS